MVPAPVNATACDTAVPTVRAVLTNRIRIGLIGVVIGLFGLFWVAATIDPYEPDGRPKSSGTHQQLGLPACNFVRLTGLPCPSCGMTTSFALLMRGDVMASMRANAVGTLLAVSLLGLIPWTAVSAARGRWVWIRSVEPWLLGAVILFIGLALIRWGIVLLGYWLNG